MVIAIYKNNPIHRSTPETRQHQHNDHARRKHSDGVQAAANAMSPSAAETFSATAPQPSHHSVLFLGVGGILK